MKLEYHPSIVASQFQCWQRLAVNLEFLRGINLGINRHTAVEMPGEKIGPASEAQISFVDDDEVDPAIGGVVSGNHIAGQDDLLNSQIRQHRFDPFQFLF